MVKIRLKKIGMRHQPSFRLVATDSRRSRDGEYLELLGQYNPRSKLLKLDLERVNYWLSRGAQATDTARRLIKRYMKEHPVLEDTTETEATTAGPAEPVGSNPDTEPTTAQSDHT